MSLLSFCEWLNETPLSIWLREAAYPYPVLLITHVMTIGVFGGMVVMGNLRVLGRALRSVPVSQVLGQFRPWKWAAGFLLLVSGTLIAMSDPLEYYDNIMFWISNAILLVAAVNAFIFRQGAFREVAGWENAPTAPRAALMWARTSLFLWIALVFAGRGMAFF
jgi:uncharacterized phage infection (PIP) family protein YhgE